MHQGECMAVLSEVRKGKIVQIVNTDLEIWLKLKLQELGLTDNILVKVLFNRGNSPLLIATNYSNIILNRQICNKIPIVEM